MQGSKFFVILNSHGVELFSRITSNFPFELNSTQIALLSVLFQNSKSTSPFCLHSIQGQQFQSSNSKTMINYLPCYPSNSQIPNQRHSVALDSPIPQEEEQKYCILLILGSVYSSTQELQEQYKWNQKIMEQIYKLILLVMGPLQFSMMHDQQVDFFTKKLKLMTQSIDQLLHLEMHYSPLVQYAKFLTLFSAPCIQYFPSSLPKHQTLKLQISKLLAAYSSKWNVYDMALCLRNQIWVCSEAFQQMLTHHTDQCHSIVLFHFFLQYRYGNENSNQSALDIPIFYQNKNVRLVSIKLEHEIDLLLLCGSNPLLFQIIQQLQDHYFAYKMCQADPDYNILTNTNSIANTPTTNENNTNNSGSGGNRNSVDDATSNAGGSSVLPMDQDVLMNWNFFDEIFSLLQNPSFTNDLKSASGKLDENLLAFVLLKEKTSIHDNSSLEQLSSPPTTIEYFVYENFASPNAKQLVDQVMHDFYLETSATLQQTRSDLYIKQKQFGLTAICKKGFQLLCCFQGLQVPNYALIPLSHETMDILISNHHIAW